MAFEPCDSLVGRAIGFAPFDSLTGRSGGFELGPAVARAEKVETMAWTKTLTEDAG